MGFVHSLLFFPFAFISWVDQSIRHAPRQLYRPSHIWRLACWNTPSSPPPPPPRAKSVFKCRTQVSDSMAKFFLKGKISDENFMSVISCEPSARWSEHFTFKLLHIKIYNTSILLERQISHTTQVRFKLFPRSGSENSQLPVGFPAKGWGGGGRGRRRLELIGALHIINDTG